MSNMPCVLEEKELRTVLYAEIENCHDEIPSSEEVVYRDGQYILVYSGVADTDLSVATLRMFETLENNYDQDLDEQVTITMCSPTDEERATIMRVWNEWNNKESENEQ